MRHCYPGKYHIGLRKNTNLSHFLKAIFTIFVQNIVGHRRHQFASAFCSALMMICNNHYKFLKMKQIVSDNAPAAIGPYSQAIEANGFVYVSGQLPIDVATGAFPEGGVKEQTRQSLLNVTAILGEAGLTLKNVVKTTVFLADMGDFAAMNEVYSQFFSNPFPARSAVAVKDLPKGAMVEVEVVAAK